VGLFLARISRGRTEREYVLGALIVQAIMCFVWFALAGSLVVAGGLDAIKSAMVIGALPFSLVMVLMCIALIKGRHSRRLARKTRRDDHHRTIACA
jgi:choline/glycine/proline betaine transport protein